MFGHCEEVERRGRSGNGMAWMEVEGMEELLVHHILDRSERSFYTKIIA